MKKAEWTKTVWAKAAAFTLATLLTPFACLCGASLLAAYEFEWWTGCNEEYWYFYVENVEGRYWTKRALDLLYSLHFGAIALLVAAAALLVFCIVYLAIVAGRRPGREEAVAGWQEKIPFDLYLVAAGLVVGVLVSVCSDAAYELSAEPVFFASVMLGCAALGTALLLGTWMTLCARVKLGAWWRNTLCCWVLRYVWRALRWCFGALRGVGTLGLALLRGIPLIWRLMLCAAGFCLLTFLLAINRMAELLFLLLSAFFLLVCAVGLQLRKLQAGGAALAAGDFDARVDTKRLFWDFRRHGENLNDISRGMQLAVDKQLKSERLKTELITNVSHDIKTPLTSIINYVDLLRRDPRGEQAEEYLEVLDRQSKRLKKLTEDLVEVSKASTGNIAVSASRRSVNELLSQALGEYGERLERAKLEAVFTPPEEELYAWLDGTLAWRVLDNVFSNACKYALPGTRFYVDARELGGKVCLSFKNISRDRLNISADELTERFVRGDASRGGEGSGLGLNIAKSLTELQGGTFAVAVDGDLFRIDVTFPRVE